MRNLMIVCWLALCLSSCREATSVPSMPTSTLSGELTPFISPTPSRTPTPLPPAKTVALTPIPTATPFTHTIARDDTLLGIALRYGVTLEELQAANPGVDPGFLVIGNTLVIPIEGQSSAEIPQPTPLPVAWSGPRCYSSGEGGLWCFILVENNQPSPIENLAGWISLYDAEGNPLGGQAAVAPLNLLPPGAAMPLLAFFAPPTPAEVIPQGQLLSAVAVENQGARYLPVEVQVETVQIGEFGLSANVQGNVLVPEGSHPSSVWLAIVAYDDAGEVIGMRKFDLGMPCGVPPTPSDSSTPQPTPGQGTPTFTPAPSETPAPLVICTPIDFTVYSMGPAIQRVEVLLEARP